MTKKFNDILSDLKAGTYAPIYILCGEEPYYADRVYEFIAENALDPMAREFDQQVVYGRDLQGADISPVISAARGYAMMGGRKVVIVREAQVVKKWDGLMLISRLSWSRRYSLSAITVNRTNGKASGNVYRTIRRSCGCSRISCGIMRWSVGSAVI